MRVYYGHVDSLKDSLDIFEWEMRGDTCVVTFVDTLDFGSGQAWITAVNVDSDGVFVSGRSDIINYEVIQWE